MPKVVRIIALIMAILMGLSAIGMIAMYVSAESINSADAPVSLVCMETEMTSCDIIRSVDPVLVAVNHC